MIRPVLPEFVFSFCLATSLSASIAATLGGCSSDPIRIADDRAHAEVAPLAELTADRPTSEQMIAMLRTLEGVLPPRPAGPGAYRLYNPEAVIPPQCYTKHEGSYNPCYVCHQDHVEGRENRQNDAHLQIAYSFSEEGLTNRWTNLFEDRRERIDGISDEEILAWIAQDNFNELAPRLREVRFRGPIPELANLAAGAAAFDADGFARDGSDWVAFSYKPMPSTFWPTNGSTDDVMIRLPDELRRDSSGRASRDVYRANLALLEATVKDLPSVTSWPIDERGASGDVDGDGRIGTASRVVRRENYFGGGSAIPAESFLYPRGTEFLHTVRYIGVGPDGAIGNAPRMKEVRYMVKNEYLSKTALGHLYGEELTAKNEGTLPEYASFGGAGLSNQQGWLIQSFLEGHDGRLRLATYEENMFCMGCHNTVGSTIDKTYSFPRKVDGRAGWGYIDLHGMPDAPSMGERQGEILTYLERVGGGVEFRNNQEMEERWYRPDGQVDRAKVLAAPDVYALVAPSPERALMLDKAYKTIVEDQDFIYGRDATVVPPTNVYDRVDPETAPALPPERSFTWDIRLDWSMTPDPASVEDRSDTSLERGAAPLASNPEASH